MNNNILDENEFEDMICPDCNCSSGKEINEEQAFQYGIYKNQKTLIAIVPVWKCDDCGFMVTGGRAEDARLKVVQDYLQEGNKQMIVEMLEALMIRCTLCDSISPVIIPEDSSILDKENQKTREAAIKAGWISFGNQAAICPDCVSKIAQIHSKARLI